MSHQIFGFAGALKFKIYLPPSKDNYVGMLNFRDNIRSRYFVGDEAY